MVTSVLSSLLKTNSTGAVVAAVSVKMWCVVLDTYLKARVRAFAYSIAADIHPINNLRVLKYLTGELGVALPPPPCFSIANMRACCEPGPASCCVAGTTS